MRNDERAEYIALLAQNKLLAGLLVVLENINSNLCKLNHPVLKSFTIHLGGSMSNAITKNIGESITATIVNPLDQFGKPFALDLTQTPPTWSLSDPNLATQAPSLDGSDLIALIAAGTESGNAMIGQVSASFTITIVQPAPVLTSFEVNLA